MKLIKIYDDGAEKYINPNYVRSMKQTHSEIHSDWCIVIELDNNKIETILTKTKEENDSIKDEIIQAMQSVN